MRFDPALLPKILDGTKTVTRRPTSTTVNVGDLIEVTTNVTIKVIDVKTVPLGSLAQAEVEKEGFITFEEFKAFWARVYGDFPAGEPVLRIELERQT